MAHEWQVEVCLRGNRELEDDLLVGCKLAKTLHKGIKQKLFALSLICGVDVNFRFENGHQTFGNNLQANLKLLLGNPLDAFLIWALDDGTLLCAEDAGSHGLVQELVELWHVLHHLHTVFLLSQTLVNLEERHNSLLLPEKLCR